MNPKAFILSMYLVALFIILKNYYDKGNSGMPYPSTITAPSYLYGVLALTSDFTGGLSTVLSAGLTLGLFYRTHMTGNDPIAVKTGPQNKTGTKKQAPPQAVKPGANK